VAWAPFAAKVSYTFQENARKSIDSVGKQAIETLVDAMIDKTIQYAREETRPGERVEQTFQYETDGGLTIIYRSVTFDEGMHPGPHEHRYHDQPQLNWSDTGNLQGSIRELTDRKWRGNRYGGSVGTDVKYGSDLEFGWSDPKTGGRHQYPWLQPSANKAWDEVADNEAMREAWERAMSRAHPSRRTGKAIKSYGASAEEELPI